MVPIPQYPLYSAQLTLDGGTMVKYHLVEEQNWGVDPDDIRNQIKNAKDLDVDVRAIVVINPGNPTGNVMSYENIVDIIRICYEHNLVIIADEVYQNNIYTQEAPFVSFRQVLHEMGEPFSSSVELFSLHSVSKGLMGECGFRGGWFEAHNFDLFAQDMLFKLKSIDLCSNTVGQMAVYQMINPPIPGEQSSQCVDLYYRERGAIENGLKERASLLASSFNEMVNVDCQPIQGAMYAFPRV
jgi:aspartate/methionine/tyrosine aminotransferase